MIIAEPHYSNKFKEMEPEKWEAFKKLWPCMPQDTKQEHYWGQQPQRLSLEEAAEIEALGIKLDYRGVDGTMLTKMKDRSDRADWDRPSAGDLMQGKAVQIAIPDLGLLVIDEVTWLDDACTQELQRHLNEGWRILAVCPPNAQRRPDYILGRRGQK